MNRWCKNTSIIWTYADKYLVNGELFNIIFYVMYCAGVSMASLTELSFNWVGFISAMISNISFTYRSIYSKKAMVISYAIHVNYLFTK